VSLTPQQQAILNQLPPSQRQQALQVLKQLERPSGESTQLSSLYEEPSTNVDPADSSSTTANFGSDRRRATSGSSLIVTLTPKAGLTREQAGLLQTDVALQGVLGSHYYALDKNGLLEMPGLPTVPLLGLESSQIEQRLAAAPELSVFSISVSILDDKATGTAALEPFGYEIFESAEYGFDPVVTGPVPADYVLGPGDSVKVQLFGNVNEIYEFEVSRDGVLNLPQLGPLTVGGSSFSEFKRDISQRVREMLIGTEVSVAMGRLRTIRIFVLGDANRPGSYVVSSLATMSNALRSSGGISRVGSLRDIQLKRNGSIVSRLDLYDLLLNGDTSGDSRLQPGDVVFIPPVGSQIGASGAVKRPAIYEAGENVSVEGVIKMAGGLTPDAYPDGASIERIESGQKRIVISVGSSVAANTLVQAGDVLTVPEVLPDLQNTVSLKGHIQRPGPYQWQAGMRLTDLIPEASALRPGADFGYVLIRRENATHGYVEALSANLEMALSLPDSPENILLQARDTIHVFSLEFGRQRFVQPILDELKLQARFGEPYYEVSISGHVLAPGAYPIEPGMRISDLIRAGGRLTEDAYAVEAELVRYEVVGNAYRQIEIVDIDLDSVLRGVASADIMLREHDNLRVSGLPEWNVLRTIALEGEVTYPGSYRIRRGETLSEVMERAGGLTDAAFPDGAIFLRASLRQREQDQIEVMAQRLESDLLSMSVANRNSPSVDARTTGQSLLVELRATEAVGRLVIDLDRVLTGSENGNFSGDLELRDGDRLLIPQTAQEVTVIGETQQNASHLFRTGLSRDDYINLSGGLTRRADKKLVYVVRANGAIVTGSRSKWFSRRHTMDIQPGDTIVVPLETDRIRPLTLWANVTQILYQAAIAVAAINSFGR